MGIDILSAQFLCYAKNIGVDFSDTMMVGRQSIHIPSHIIPTMLNDIGVPREKTSAVLNGAFAEPLFSLLGARQVSSIDVSDYESPTNIHDFNSPLPDSLINQFSVVYDGGSIEHVFNIPQAFKNCMEMVRIGGHFIQVNEANNFMGHGFWQFCPELIYRIFSRENGFRIKAVLLRETNPYVFGPKRGSSWYKVDDPASHHCRVLLTNQNPTFIFTIAERVAEERIFARFPQQSDYVENWERGSPERGSPGMDAPAVRATIRDGLARPMRRLARRCLDTVGIRRGPFAYPYYHRISDDDLVRGRI